MENASKALIMAASILIGVVIMTFAVYLYISTSSSVNEINAQMEDSQLLQFNNQFTSYVDKGKTEGLTIYDIITVTNLARQNNDYYELTKAEDSNYYITVNMPSKSNLEKMTDTELSKYLKLEENLSEEIETSKDTSTNVNKTEMKKYECTVTINANTGRVNVVAFTAKQ